MRLVRLTGLTRRVLTLVGPLLLKIGPVRRMLLFIVGAAVVIFAIVLAALAGGA